MLNSLTLGRFSSPSTLESSVSLIFERVPESNCSIKNLAQIMLNHELIAEVRNKLQGSQEVDLITGSNFSDMVAISALMVEVGVPLDKIRPLCSDLVGVTPVFELLRLSFIRFGWVQIQTAFTNPFDSGLTKLKKEILKYYINADPSQEEIKRHGLFYDIASLYFLSNENCELQRIIIKKVIDQKIVDQKSNERSTEFLVNLVQEHIPLYIDYLLVRGIPERIAVAETIKLARCILSSCSFNIKYRRLLIKSSISISLYASLGLYSKLIDPFECLGFPLEYEGVDELTHYRELRRGLIGQVSGVKGLEYRVMSDLIELGLKPFSKISERRCGYYHYTENMFPDELILSARMSALSNANTGIIPKMIFKDSIISDWVDVASSCNIILEVLNSGYVRIGDRSHRKSYIYSSIYELPSSAYLYLILSLSGRIDLIREIVPVMDISLASFGEAINLIPFNIKRVFIEYEIDA